MSFCRPKCCARIENNASAPRLRNGVTPQELLKQKLSPQSRPLNFRSAEVRHEVRPQASSSPSANRLLPSSQANSRPRLHHHHHLPRQQQRPRPAPSGKFISLVSFIKYLCFPSAENSSAIKLILLPLILEKIPIAVSQSPSIIFSTSLSVLAQILD